MHISNRKHLIYHAMVGVLYGPRSPTNAEKAVAQAATDAIVDRLERYRPSSNLYMHAERELDHLGEEPKMVKMYLDMIEIFASYGHSGGSASVAIPTLQRLLSFENLTPLTDDPDEWEQVSPEQWPSNEQVWQSTRRADAFSNDGGKTYYCLSDPPGDDGEKVIHTSKEKPNG